ncbi:MAG: proprotein convertase P-domain-containing protein [Planctomycetota bacterium]|nr:proprotein convertase P-domain-containing protein [Planctomycetota bacterium]
MRQNRMKVAAFLAAAAGLAGFNTAMGQQYTSSPGLAIPDEPGPSVQDTITVTGGPTSISNMAVIINITHTWDADLDIVLVRNGQTLHLTSDNGGSGDNYTNTRFIDSAATSITAGLAPFTGDFRPEGGDPGWAGTIVIPGVFLANLAGFNGQDSNGAWDLVIDDDIGADVGTLNSWTLDFSPGAPPPPPPGPPNDLCINATPVGEGTHAFDNTLANTEYAAVTCPIGNYDVFYLYTPTFTGTARINTCGQTGLDTTLTVLSECLAGEIACNDDTCGLQSQVEIPVTTGVPVIVRIASWSSAARGSGTFTITELAPATNDLCANATAVGEGSFSWDNSGTGTEGFASCGFGADPGSSDIYFTYTPTFTGLCQIDTCNSAVDTILTAYSDCSQAAEIACNDDFCGLQSGIQLDVTAGVPLTIRVAGWQGDTGAGVLNIAQLFPGPQPNDLCANAEATGDATISFDTTGALANGPGVCGGSAASPDIFYLWTPTNSGCGLIETCGSGYDTVLEVLSACGTSVLCNDDACGLQSRIEIPSVTAGVPVLVRVSGFAGQSGAGVVTFTSSPSTPYTPPGSGTTEAEACGNNPDTINSGCNSTPPSFLPIACGETIIGTTFVIPNTTRDTDWFTFTLGDVDSVTVTGQAQIPVNAYLLQINDCATFDISIIALGNNTACDPSFNVSAANLPPGEYVFFIASTNFTNVSVCGTNTENWWATLTLGNGCGGSPCDPDVNQDGNVDQDDIACLSQAVAGNPGCLGGGVDPDFNQDGNVDQDDIAALEQVVAGSPCP